MTILTQVDWIKKYLSKTKFFSVSYVLLYCYIQEMQALLALNLAKKMP